MKSKKCKFLFILLFVTLCGCASNQQALLSGQTLEGTPICLDNRDKIPVIVRKFFNTRDLTTEEGKIDYLIERICDSKLVFIRNKVEYDSPSAASFLRWKLNRWQKKGVKIDTAEKFISFISSGSKTSGEPYAVILQDGSHHNLQSVLQNELDALLYCLKQYPTAEEKSNLTDETQPNTAAVPESP